MIQRNFQNIATNGVTLRTVVEGAGPLVILAAVCGGLLYGLLGALLAIPSMAALMLLYREVLIPELNRR